MKCQKMETSFGIFTMEEKESIEDKDKFVGAIRLTFKPNMPTKLDGSELKCFSLKYPGQNSYIPTNRYEWLMSWYKGGRNVNTFDFDD